METILRTYLGLLLICSLTVVSSNLVEKHTISFEEYCIKQELPTVFPGNGELSGGVLIMSSNQDEGHAYEPGLNCSVTFQADNHYQLFIAFSQINIRNQSLDNLTIIYGSEHNKSIVLSGHQVCSNENCTGLKFRSGEKNPNITMDFKSANRTLPRNVNGFKAVYTVFDLVDPKSGTCHGTDRFKCKNEHCIWNGFVCDGHNNCGDLSDEKSCSVSLINTIWGIAVIAIGILALMIFMPTFCFLAVSGTRNTVTSTTLPVQPTPMYSSVNNAEHTHLLSSSDNMAATDCCPSTYDSRRHSYSYGTVSNTLDQPSTSQVHKSFKSIDELINVEQNVS